MRRHLLLEVEGRVYAQAAPQDGVDPVLADQLLLHHLREVAGWRGPVRPDSTIGAIGHLRGIGSSSALIWSGLLM